MSFIDLIKQSTYRQSGLIKGIGDDAAVFRHTANDIVSAVDVFVENIHFSRDTMTPFHIGYRALAANLSDMAAMGATPTYILVAIVVPKGDRKSTRLNSSHVSISYAVFCLKKKIKIFYLFSNTT